MNPILVVEDNEVIRETMTELLEMSGYSVTSAENGKVALETMESGPLPRLILLDLMMPIMDGWEFRERQMMNKTFASIPVIAVSGAADQGDTYGLKPAAWVNKPVNVSQLLELVEDFYH